MTDRPANPKQIHGDRKVPVHLVPPALTIGAAKAFHEGVIKGYGPYNWRESKIEAMTYIAGILRHVYSFMDGEDVDPESLTGKLHLEGIAACVGILLDTFYAGTMIDNRPPKSCAPKLLRDPGKPAATGTITILAGGTVQKDEPVVAIGATELAKLREALAAQLLPERKAFEVRSAYTPRAGLDKASNDWAHANGMLDAQYSTQQIRAAQVAACPKMTCDIQGQCSYPSICYAAAKVHTNKTDDLTGLAARESLRGTDVALRDARVEAGAFDVLINDPPSESFVKATDNFEAQLARAQAFDHQRQLEAQANIDRMRAEQAQATQDKINRDHDVAKRAAERRGEVR